MLTLYYSPGACSLAAHIILETLELDYKTIKVDLGSHRTENNQDYYDINPLGAVPVLLIENKTLLTQNTAILSYLGSLDKHSTIFPASDSFEHFRCYEWLSLISADLHKSFGPLFHPGVFVDSEPSKIILQQNAEIKIQKILTLIEKKLQPGKFLLGNHFSVADSYLFVIARWLKHFNFDGEKTLPHFSALIEKISVLPAVKSALEKEKLT